MSREAAVAKGLMDLGSGNENQAPESPAGGVASVLGLPAGGGGDPNAFLREKASFSNAA